MSTLLTLTDTAFPLSIIEHKKYRCETLFASHLHKNHIQLFYFLSGTTNIFCQGNIYSVQSGDIILINTNEFHYGESNFNELHYFVFRIDLKLLATYNIPAITSKYIIPIHNNLIVFKHKIISKKITSILKNMTSELRVKNNTYELNLLSYQLQLLGELIKNHQSKNSCTVKCKEILMKKQSRFANVFKYIEANYCNPITLTNLAKVAHLSEGYFCRLFKQSTGRTPIDYINYLRIEKSIILLNQGICNITEAGMSVGFDDINYYSRVFKKYMDQSPENYLKNEGKYRI